MTQKYFVIKYRNPKNEIQYCINGSKNKERLQFYWRLCETPQKYNLIDMIEVVDIEKAITWINNHKLLSVRNTEKNIKFLNEITNNEFNKIYEK